MYYKKNSDAKDFLRGLINAEERKRRDLIPTRSETEKKRLDDFQKQKPRIIEKAWTIFDEAIDFLFEKQHVNNEQRSALYDLMAEQIYYCHCSVMYAPSKRAKKLCDELGLDMGRREIDINDSMHLEKIEDYERRLFILPSQQK